MWRGLTMLASVTGSCLPTGRRPVSPTGLEHAIHTVDISVTATSAASALRLLCPDGRTGCRVIVDATRADVLLPPTLASLVRLRRRVAATGGSLVVVAGDGAGRSIRRSGLQYSLPCAPNLSEAC